MNVQDYIKVYENVVDEKLCDLIMSARLDYKSSTFSDHDGTISKLVQSILLIKISKISSLYKYYSQRETVIMVHGNVQIYYLQKI